ncbi:MAG: hypothetical protein JZU55_05455 [Afipia sp.]|nr:hypothetical protein [Afipia sp.]
MITAKRAGTRSSQFASATLLFLLSACSHWLEPGTYRLAAQSDEAPTAYRNILNASEQLTIPIRLINQGDRPLYVAHDRNDGQGPDEGLTIQARLLTPSPYIENAEANVTIGLSGGRTLQRLSNDHKLPFVDQHQAAVDRLAQSGPWLLNMKEDDIRTGFRLLGNEVLALLVAL